MLRHLARKYAEIAQNDSNGKLRILHRAVNDLQMIRPIVLIDDLPRGELNINGELTLQCQDKDFRTAETYMRQTLYRFYHFQADMIVRPYIPVEKIIHSTGYGIEIKEETIQHNGDTHIVSHEYQDQFADCEGLEKLHKCVITYDEEATNQIYYKIANAIGDIIPVKKTGQNYLSAVTWDNIAEYRGVEPLLMDLIAEPEFSHQLAQKMSELIRDRNEQFLKLGLYDTDPEHLHNTSTLCSALHPELDNTDYKNIWGRGTA